MKFRIICTDNYILPSKRYLKLKDNFKMLTEDGIDYIFINNLEELLSIENVINENIIVSNSGSIPSIEIYDENRE